MLKRAETVLFRQPAAPIKKQVEDDRKMKDVPKPISAKLDEAMIFGSILRRYLIGSQPLTST